MNAKYEALAAELKAYPDEVAKIKIRMSTVLNLAVEAATIQALNDLKYNEECIAAGIQNVKGDPKKTAAVANALMKIAEIYSETVTEDKTLVEVLSEFSSGVYILPTKRL